MSEDTVADETMDDVRAGVHATYVAAASVVLAGGSVTSESCCDGSGVGVGRGFGAGRYRAEELRWLPGAASAASLGCGNPAAAADLVEGERVLDLGSGGGIDVLLSARLVGPKGRVYGLDLLDEMLELAGANARRAGVDNVEFLKGSIEAVPLPAATVDVVISNCVISLAVDKGAVFAEAFRVLRPGGRFAVCDVVAGEGLTIEEQIARGSFAGCLAGALAASEYRAGLRAAGFIRITVEPSHEITDGMRSAIVRADKPKVCSCGW
ncbi:methyltransferase domain-containing protein [Embleya sp. NPDC059237]|uniref:methyltransferase domain-containing protein n=1 Tax=Embleya sp. NPDC059237 TaxID=3346784 RepID=UPI0036A93B0F